jgi:hypothetical protein
MKRIRAHGLLLFVGVACLVPAIAAAKTHRAPTVKSQPAPPLPDRNPHRAEASASPMPEVAAPASEVAVPAPEAALLPEAVPASDVAPTTDVPATPTDAQTVTGTLPLPDRNPSSSVPMTLPPVPTVTPTAGSSAAVTIVPLPDRNPKAPVVPAALLAPPSAPVPPAPAPVGQCRCRSPIPIVSRRRFPSQ